MLNFRQKTPKKQTKTNQKTKQKTNKKTKTKQTNQKKPQKQNEKNKRKQTDTDFAYFFLCYLLYFLLIWSFSFLLGYNKVDKKLSYVTSMMDYFFIFRCADSET